jgi:chemotaxis protein histidine kinase CheA
MFFLNFTIALLFVVLFLAKIGLINKKTSSNIFNNLYNIFNLKQTVNSFQTTLCNEEHHNEVHQQEEQEQEEQEELEESEESEESEELEQEESEELEQEQEEQEELEQEQEQQVEQQELEQQVEQQELEQQQEEQQELEQQEEEQEELEQQKEEQQELEQQEEEQEELEQQEEEQQELEQQKEEQQELEQQQEQQPYNDILSNSILYKYNPLKHYKKFLNKTFSNTENYEVNFKLQLNDLEEIQTKLQEKVNPTIRDLNNILSNISYEYTFHNKDIIKILGYKIPVITEEQKKQIITHFKNNKIKFSKCKNGKIPFISFYNIYEESAKDLNISTGLELIKDNNNTTTNTINLVNENNLIDKKNN